MNTWLLLPTLAFFLATNALVADEGNKETDRLQGTWSVVSAERDGKPSNDVKGHHLTFAGDKFTIKSQDGTLLFEGTYQLDPSKKPGTINFLHIGGALKGKTWKGIYSLEGDLLKECDNAPNLDKDRPTTFSAKAGSGHIAIVFKRAKP